MTRYTAAYHLDEFENLELIDPSWGILQARFYKDDSGIPQEKSFWSTLSNPVAPTTAAQSSRGSAEWVRF